MPSAYVVTLMGDTLAQALKDQTLYVAVGEGEVAWDSVTPLPQPASGQIALVNELARVVSTTVYLDESERPVAGPTRRIECQATFAIGVANGTLREMGIFAYGSGTLGSGQLIAAVNFAAIEKPSGGSDYSLARLMRLAFLAG
jgi:hypothetical protein